VMAVHARREREERVVKAYDATNSPSPASVTSIDNGCKSRSCHRLLSLQAEQNDRHTFPARTRSTRLRWESTETSTSYVERNVASAWAACPSAPCADNVVDGTAVLIGGGSGGGLGVGRVEVVYL
jgi:hypothetical protein